MPLLLQELRNKLMSPLKNAILGASVTISPQMINNLADTEISKAVDEVSQMLEPEIQKLLQSIGHEKIQIDPMFDQEDSAARSKEIPSKDQSPKEEKENFPPKQKNDILDENKTPEKSEPKPSEDEDNSDNSKNTSDPQENDKSSIDIEEAEREAKEKEARLPEEKGIVTKAANRFVFSREKIQKLEAEKKAEKKFLRDFEREMKWINVELIALKGSKLALEAAKLPALCIYYPLTAFNLTGGFCLLLSVVPATLIITNFIAKYITLLNEQIKILSKKIGRLEYRKRWLYDKVKELKEKIAKIEEQIYRLENAGMIEGLAKKESPQP